jgi:aminopeptidase N
MRKFLKYELDRYLRGRGAERKKEVPLERVENQPYIHYSKGGMVMYALQDAIGEDKVNQALKALRDRVAYQEPPYAISTDFVDELRKVVPADRAYLVHDLFEAITLYENRALSATYRPVGKGKYEVTLKVKAKKVQADETGNEHEVPLNDWIDVGLLDDQGRVAYREKRRITQPETELKLTVSWIPAKAGIDPLSLLIDRQPDDNVVKVERTSS